LVSLPVSLFPANRSTSGSLKMVDRDGTPLSRRYFCEKEGKALTSDEIVRGYEIDQDRFVVVSDDELDALAPDKTREIDLRRFVPLGDINPVFFDRGYFLAPDADATKAYRLLAKSMEDEQRAGIATFVMRGKEYIIAILAEKGILRAETLRFHDEIRSPQDIGLGQMPKPDSKLVSEWKKAIKSNAAQTLDRSLLVDRQTQRTLELARKKLEAGKDVVDVPEETRQAEEEESNVIDLMQVLKERLQGKGSPESTSKGKSDGKSKPNGKGKKNGEKLDKLSRDELYQLATEKEIAGRSKMNKKELVSALRAPES
ncbi:MAG: Ku protein, partial [Wenzhouxiangella sp.]